MAKSKNRKPAKLMGHIVIEPEETAVDLVEEIGEDAANDLEEITAGVDVETVNDDVEEDQENDGVDGAPEPVEEPVKEPAQTLEVLQDKRRELALKLG